MAYSMDLRSKVLQAVDEGRASKIEIARIFGVTRQWINQLLRRRRAELDGTFAGLKRRGPKPRRVWLLRLRRNRGRTKDRF